ncbi:MAG: hypothetical protein HPY55_06620 [Firmicutes bacterium]|nr:hypothetical protein [Bacillota bacterium]
MSPAVNGTPIARPWVTDYGGGLAAANCITPVGVSVTARRQQQHGHIAAVNRSFVVEHGIPELLACDVITIDMLCRIELLRECLWREFRSRAAPGVREVEDLMAGFSKSLRKRPHLVAVFPR